MVFQYILNVNLIIKKNCNVYYIHIDDKHGKLNFEKFKKDFRNGNSRLSSITNTVILDWNSRADLMKMIDGKLELNDLFYPMKRLIKIYNIKSNTDYYIDPNLIGEFLILFQNRCYYPIYILSQNFVRFQTKIVHIKNIKSFIQNYNGNVPIYVKYNQYPPNFTWVDPFIEFNVSQFINNQIKNNYNNNQSYINKQQVQTQKEKVLPIPDNMQEIIQPALNNFKNKHSNNNNYENEETASLSSTAQIVGPRNDDTSLLNNSNEKEITQSQQIEVQNGNENENENKADNTNEKVMDSKADKREISDSPAKSMHAQSNHIALESQESNAQRESIPKMSEIINNENQDVGSDSNNVNNGNSNKPNVERIFHYQDGTTEKERLKNNKFLTIPKQDIINSMQDENFSIYNITEEYNSQFSHKKSVYDNATDKYYNTNHPKFELIDIVTSLK